MTKKKLIHKVIADLKAVNPLKIILFGSYAKGDFDDDSDIDLVVILDSEIIPGTYRETLDLKLTVRESIYELSRKISIDLVVYTNGEFELIKSRKTSFFNELMDTGTVIYEKAG